MRDISAGGLEQGGKDEANCFCDRNAGKMKEIKEILSDMDAEVVSMKDAGIAVDIEENGKTFEENAVIKAKAVAALTEDAVLADDSGLEVDYLNGEPGFIPLVIWGRIPPILLKIR